MRARIWGCRGSLAAPGPRTVRYGGNTSCVEVCLADGTLLIFDAGSGIMPLGLSLKEGEARTIHLILTHLHFDHLEGLGFFAPLWNAHFDVHIWGPAEPPLSLRERIARYFSPPLFPARLSEIPAKVRFHDVPEGVWKLASANILAEPVTHPGTTLGIRIEEAGRTLAYIPDHEPAYGCDLDEVEPEMVSGYGVAEGADVLLHDAQYTEDEYPARVGWGHSSVAHTVRFAELTNPKQLVLDHHDPLRSDDELEALLDRAHVLWGDRDGAPQLAAEGMEIDLSNSAG